MRDKNTVTHISCCNIGDRFYRARDEHKIVWQVSKHTAKRIRGEMRKVSLCKTDAGEQHTFLSTTMIVFLSKRDAKKIPPVQLKLQ